MQGYLQQAAMRHLQRWSSVLYQPQYYPSMEAQINGTFSVAQTWLQQRLRWGPALQMAGQQACLRRGAGAGAAQSAKLWL